MPGTGPAPGSDDSVIFPRRGFLRRAGRVSAGILCGGALFPMAGCAGIPRTPAILERGRLRVDEAAFARSTVVLVDHPEDARPILLRRLPEGGYVAVSTRCTHRGCQVEPQGDRLACPCHGSEYAVTGEVLQGPAEDSLQRFPLEAHGGAILISLSPR